MSQRSGHKQLVRLTMTGMIATGTIPMSLFSRRKVKTDEAGTHGLKVQALKEDIQILRVNTILPTEASQDPPAPEERLLIEAMIADTSRM